MKSLCNKQKRLLRFFVFALLFSSCKEDDNLSKANSNHTFLIDVVEAVGGIEALNSKRVISYTSQGETFEHEQDNPRDGPHKVNEYAINECHIQNGRAEA